MSGGTDDVEPGESLDVDLKIYPGYTALVTTLLGSYGTGPYMGAEVLTRYLAAHRITSSGPMIVIYHHLPGTVPPNKQRLDVQWVLPPSAKGHRPEVPWVTVQEISPLEVLALGRHGPTGFGETQALWAALNMEARRLALTVDGPAHRVFYDPLSLDEEGGEQWTEMQLPVRRLAS